LPTSAAISHSIARTRPTISEATPMHRLLLRASCGPLTEAAPAADPAAVAELAAQVSRAPAAPGPHLVFARSMRTCSAANSRSCSAISCTTWRIRFAFVSPRRRCAARLAVTASMREACGTYERRLAKWWWRLGTEPRQRCFKSSYLRRRVRVLPVDLHIGGCPPRQRCSGLRPTGLREQGALACDRATTANHEHDQG
jgi:hypothetical protein